MEKHLRRTDKHHVFFPRRHYGSGLDSTFRNHRGLVVPTFMVSHRLLHLEVPPPSKPSRELMGGALETLADFDIRRGRLSGVIAVRDYFDQQAECNPSPEQADTALEVADNLDRQIGYMTMSLSDSRQELHRAILRRFNI
jgi:hypothetical protein